MSDLLNNTHAAKPHDFRIVPLPVGGLKTSSHLVARRWDKAEFLQIMRAKCHWLEGFAAAHQSTELKRHVEAIRGFLNTLEDRG